MTAPSLDALRDIHLPPLPMLVTALPPAWLVVLVLLLLVVAFCLARRWLRLRPLRTTLRDLAQLASFHARDADTTRLARGVSRLLRRYAMTRFSQPGIAGLTGKSWLDFLDAHGGDGAFCHGVGAALETLPYQSCGALDEAALIALVRRWLQDNPP